MHLGCVLHWIGTWKWVKSLENRRDPNILGFYILASYFVNSRGKYICRKPNPKRKSKRFNNCKIFKQPNSSLVILAWSSMTASMMLRWRSLGQMTTALSTRKLRQGAAIASKPWRNRDSTSVSNISSGWQLPPHAFAGYGHHYHSEAHLYFLIRFYKLVYVFICFSLHALTIACGSDTFGAWGRLHM